MTTDPTRLDPTRTTMLRRSFMRQMDKRFMKLKGKINFLLIEEDALGLIDRRKGFGGLRVNTRWQFASDPEKLKRFDDWLDAQVNAQILERTNTVAEIEDVWTSDFIKRAYVRGELRALQGVKVTGTGAIPLPGTPGSFSGVVSVDKLRLLQTRALDALGGVTKAMSNDMSRILAEGLLAGQSPYEIAAEINRRVDGIGINRARTIARTEIVRAHAEGALNRMEAMGVSEVGVEVEWHAKKGMCELCAALHGVVIPIKKAHGMFPRHPNCRCTPIPAFESPNNRKLQEAVKKSVKKEVSPKSRSGKKRNLETRIRKSSWSGARHVSGAKS